jgi:hypothetical protein
MSLPNNKMTCYMKKLLYLLIFTTAAVWANAQVTLSPASFTAEDQITVTVDVTGTAMAGAAEAYVWMWGNAGDSPLNTSWTNSPATAKMTAAGTNKWSFTFTPTLLWGLPPVSLTRFNFLVKKKDGSAQTSDFGPYFFDPLVFVPTKLRVFPAKVDKTDVVSVNFDRTLGETADEQRMTPTSATITMFNEAGTQVGSPLNVNVRVLADNIWIATFIPSASFNPGAGHVLKRFRYKFNGTALNDVGGTVNVSTSEAEVTFTTMQ